MIGHLSAIDAAIKDLKQHGLVLKVEDDFHDYLSCEIVFSEGRKKAWLGQPHLICQNDYRTINSLIEMSIESSKTLN